METMITVERLTKAFGSRCILDELTFNIPTGSVTAVTGPSGSGKSTLLNILGLLESPTSGQVRIDGVPIPDINSNKATRLRRNTINYLFQSFALVNHLNVTENILLAMKYTGMEKQEKLDKIHSVLKHLGIYELREGTVSALSGGEQQRVAIARCILKPGEIILADEPTGSLDSKLAQAVFETILSLRDEYQKTILLVTHDLTIARQCDRCLQLSAS